ncbi:hypothetical protein D3C71_1759750 [compost metagenome]
MIGFGFNLNFKLLLSHPAGKRNLLGDDGRRRQRQRHILGPRATLFYKSTQRVSDLVKLFDVAICNPAAFQRLNGTTLQNETARLIAAQLHQFDAGRADIDSQQRY